MRHRFLCLMLLASALATQALVGCGTDNRACVRTETRCTDSCQTWSDPWYGVWTECRTWCEPVCVQREAARPAICLGNPVCAPGHPCHDDAVCPTAPPQPPRGAGLCQACNTSTDCYEDHALCLQLEDSPTAPGYCGRDCDVDADCPGGFFCAELVETDDRQCTPTAFTCVGLERGTPGG